MNKLTKYLANVEELSLLNLSNNPFTDKGFVNVCKKLDNIKIKKIDISGTGCTYLSLKRLKKCSLHSGKINSIIAKNLNLSKN